MAVLTVGLSFAATSCKDDDKNSEANGRYCAPRSMLLANKFRYAIVTYLGETKRAERGKEWNGLAMALDKSAKDVREKAQLRLKWARESS